MRTLGAGAADELILRNGEDQRIGAVLHGEADDRTELLIFVTPRIVNRLEATVSQK
jgi:hypothetical protein